MQARVKGSPWTISKYHVRCLKGVFFATRVPNADPDRTFDRYVLGKLGFGSNGGMSKFDDLRTSRKMKIVLIVIVAPSLRMVKNWFHFVGGML